MGQRSIRLAITVLTGVLLVEGTASTVPVTAQSRSAQVSLLPIYRACQSEYDVPWELMAAIDRYAQLTKSKSDREEAPYYGFVFRPTAWAGLGNPIADDVDPLTVHLFRGLGIDGNYDGLALPWDPADRIRVLASWLDLQSGEEDTDAAVWDLFQDPVAMDRIFAFAEVFRRYGIDPDGYCFPIARRYRYDVKHTFGAARSWGGRRIHEGVDIFASYGTPVLACTHGYIELLGWNRYGGWRIGLRDTNNVYYYYAHLSGFSKGLHQGQVVEPGQLLGYVGSSGYGPPGTSGKFPPHLHFGMYRDTGRHEWAFSPSGSMGHWAHMAPKGTQTAART